MQIHCWEMLLIAASRQWHRHALILSGGPETSARPLRPCLSSTVPTFLTLCTTLARVQSEKEKPELFLAPTGKGLCWMSWRASDSLGAQPTLVCVPASSSDCDLCKSWAWLEEGYLSFLIHRPALFAEDIWGTYPFWNIYTWTTFWQLDDMNTAQYLESGLKPGVLYQSWP